MNQSRADNHTELPANVTKDNEIATEPHLQFGSSYGPTPGPLLYAFEWLLAHAVLLGEGFVF